jgi:copper resistance protein C
MRKWLPNLAAAGFAAALSVAVAEPAVAHAIIFAAKPSAEQHVAPGKLAIRIEFNSRIDKERSRLQLTAPDGAKSDIAIEPAGEPNVISGTTGELAAGAYMLRWQVLAIDGHITRGDIPFSVDN